jgi:hypothetical protein
MAAPLTKSPTDKRPDAATEAAFKRLAAEWDAATRFLSSMEAASSHPAYRQIVALGTKVVPLLLRDMEQNHSHWFAALREITGASPVPPAAAGDIPKMVEAWLTWARVNGWQW